MKDLATKMHFPTCSRSLIQIGKNKLVKIKNWREILEKDYRNLSGTYKVGNTDQLKSFGKSLTLCILKMPSGLSCQWTFKIFHPYDYGLLK